MKLYKWEEAKKLIESGTVFLEFTTSWCGDCKMMEPVVENAESLIKEFRKEVKFIKVDAEEANLFKDAKSEFSVLKVPSFFAIENGKQTHIGYEYLPVEKLVKHFEK